MGCTVQLLPGQQSCRKAFAGYDHQWIQCVKEWRILSELKLEFYGIRNHPLVVNLVGTVEGHIARDEYIQFFRFIVSVKQGECVSGEVFEGLERMKFIGYKQLEI